MLEWEKKKEAQACNEDTGRTSPVINSLPALPIGLLILVKRPRPPPL
jgi:hypothetical protein